MYRQVGGTGQELQGTSLKGQSDPMSNQVDETVVVLVIGIAVVVVVVAVVGKHHDLIGNCLVVGPSRC